MKAELKEVMNMSPKLQCALDFGTAPTAEQEALTNEVAEIMDALFEAMKQVPNE